MQTPRAKMVKVEHKCYLDSVLVDRQPFFGSTIGFSGTRTKLGISKVNTMFHVEQSAFSGHHVPRRTMHHFAALHFCSVLVYIHQDALLSIFSSSWE